MRRLLNSQWPIDLHQLVLVVPDPSNTALEVGVLLE
jgi:hypothetical protein